MIVVVMGVAGTGKSSVGAALADSLGWPFCEGDALHPEANRAKMAAGRPLTDEDRWPWLGDVARWMARPGGPAVVACSALRRPYRDVLRTGAADVRFLHLDAPADELDRRLRARAGHFMPPSLLASQLSTLEPLAADEAGARIGAADGSIEDIVERAAAQVRSWLAEGPSEGVD